MRRFLLIITVVMLCSGVTFAAEPTNSETQQPSATQSSTSSSGKGNKDDFTVIMSTKFDFSETSINGEMKAPDGFYLQGRQQQSLSEMVKLRSNFKRELRNSGAAVRSLAK